MRIRDRWLASIALDEVPHHVRDRQQPNQHPPLVNNRQPAQPLLEHHRRRVCNQVLGVPQWGGVRDALQRKGGESGVVGAYRLPTRDRVGRHRVLDDRAHHFLCVGAVSWALQIERFRWGLPVEVWSMVGG